MTDLIGNLIKALRRAQGHMRHSPSCAETIERGTWRCTCGMTQALDEVAKVIRDAEAVS